MTGNPLENTGTATANFWLQTETRYYKLPTPNCPLCLAACPSNI
jgi:hypothetical protein